MLTLLNKEQKEAIGLLQIGTLLEYFDLMIYVHMAFFLTEVMNHWGVWLLMIFLSLGFTWAIYHFEKLEGCRHYRSLSAFFKLHKNTTKEVRYY